MSVRRIDFTQLIMLAATKVPDGLLIPSMIAELKNTWAFLSWSVNKFFYLKNFFFQIKI